MKLCDCKEGQEFYITSIQTDEITLKRLEIMGVKSGKKMFVAKESFGSVLLVSSGKMVALGKALTQVVNVDACDNCG